MLKMGTNTGPVTGHGGPWVVPWLKGATEGDDSGDTDTCSSFNWDSSSSSSEDDYGTYACF